MNPSRTRHTISNLPKYFSSPSLPLWPCLLIFPISVSLNSCLLIYWLQLPVCSNIWKFWDRIVLDNGLIVFTSIWKENTDYYYLLRLPQQGEWTDGWIKIVIVKNRSNNRNNLISFHILLILCFPSILFTLIVTLKNRNICQKSWNWLSCPLL